MSLRLLYMLPMLLGRTFDARTNTIGLDIFPKEATEQPMIIPETLYGSSYKTIESTSDVRDLLGIQGDLSLKIKSNTFNAKGVGSYLKETLDREDSVETLLKVIFRTYSLTLPSSATPFAYWKSLGSDFLGTHYVQSIIYGGDLIASVRFKALKKEYMQQIRGMVKASLEAGNALQLVADGKLEMLEEKLKGMANVEVSYFATVPLEGVPNSIVGLSELVKNFQHHVKKVNGGWGVPMEVDLGDLSTFDSKIQYLKNSLLESELTYFEECFNDLLSSKAKLKHWIKSLPLHLPEDLENKIEDLRERLSKTLRQFHRVIANLDMSGNVGQLQPASLAYKQNGKSELPGKFTRELKRLIKRTVIEAERAPRKGSSVYIRYGKDVCPDLDGTTTVFSGYVASSDSNATGAGVNFICLPKKPQNAVDEEEVQGSTLQGVKFDMLESTPFHNEIDLAFGSVLCAMCQVEERTSSVMLPGFEKCPDHDWVVEYLGFVMSSTSNRAQYICVDDSPDSFRGETTKTDQRINTLKITRNDGALTMPCVVCTK